MQPCACRDCMEISAAAPKIEAEEIYSEESEDWEPVTTVTLPLCWECEEAGCTPYPSTQFIQEAIEYAEASHAYDCEVVQR